MSLLEYATHTVPDVVQKAVPSFYNSDALMKLIKARGNVKRSGGTHVRLKRIKSGHSDVTEINATNMSVPLSKKETFSTMTGDWARYVKPMILPRYDLNRLGRAEEKKAYTKDVAEAAMLSLKNDVCRRFYIGDTPSAAKLGGLGTLNGGRTAAPNGNGTSSGLTNGALEFDIPATQGATGNQYLNEARTHDATNDENNWYNQFAQHGGIGTSFLSTCEQIKLTADSYSEDSEGISIAIVSINDQVAIADEVRSYPGGNATPIMYTTADWDGGNIHKPIVAAAGMRFFSNRWMTAAALGNYAGGAAINEAAYLLNPNYVECWVNAGENFRVGKFFDGMEHGNQDALIGYIFLELQFVLTSLVTQGCTRAV